MAAEDESKDCPFSRAVRETLGAVAAPVLGEALIRDALALADLIAIPKEREALSAFARGALRTVAERALGVELAESVADEILLMIPPAPDTGPRSEGPPATPRIPMPRGHHPSWPSFRRTSTPPVTRRTPRVVARAWPNGIGSYIRPSSGEPPVAFDEPPPGMTHGASAPPSQPRPEIPLVLVSTEDDALLQTLAAWFGARARVWRIRTAAELARHLDSANGQRCVVIVDGKSPSIRPAAVVALLEDQPAVVVVLCRAAAATEQVVLASSEATKRWLIYREPASLDHVAAECVRLVS